MASDILGKSKNLGQGQNDRGGEFVHGIKNVVAGDPWNAARCIHGEPTEREVQPDSDLGKSVKPNCRNVVRRERTDTDHSVSQPSERISQKRASDPLLTIK